MRVYEQMRNFCIFRNVYTTRLVAFSGLVIYTQRIHKYEQMSVMKKEREKLMTEIYTNL